MVKGETRGVSGRRGRRRRCPRRGRRARRPGRVAASTHSTVPPPATTAVRPGTRRSWSGAGGRCGAPGRCAPTATQGFRPGACRFHARMIRGFIHGFRPLSAAATSLASSSSSRRRVRPLGALGSCRPHRKEDLAMARRLLHLLGKVAPNRHQVYVSYPGAGSGCGWASAT